MGENLSIKCVLTASTTIKWNIRSCTVATLGLKVVSWTIFPNIIEINRWLKVSGEVKNNCLWFVCNEFFFQISKALERFRNDLKPFLALKTYQWTHSPNQDLNQWNLHRNCFFVSWCQRHTVWISLHKFLRTLPSEAQQSRVSVHKESSKKWAFHQQHSMCQFPQIEWNTSSLSSMQSTQITTFSHSRTQINKNCSILHSK